MEELNDFFDFSKPFKRIAISGGAVAGRTVPNPIYIKKDVKREEVGHEYVEKYQKAERETMIRKFSHDDQQSTSSMHNTSNFDDLDDLSECDNSEVKLSNLNDMIYEKYKFDKRVNEDLTIFDSQAEILQTIRKNAVCVIQGSTGCGKTTQVPQYILNEAYRNREYCNIIVTQPRRIATTSIAARISKERNWPLGSLVGYQVGLKTEASEDTRLLFCTTGVLLEKLIHRKTMSNYTHIILDEVHERGQDMDFVFIIIRRLLATNSPNVKVILMSATIDATQFCNYFRTPKNKVLVPAPLVKIEKKSPYKVETFYLNELKRLKMEVNVDYQAPGIDPIMYSLGVKLVVVCCRLDNQKDPDEPQDTKNAILIFLPGKHEIDTLQDKIQKSEMCMNQNVVIHVLHSEISPEYQRKAFRPSEHGQRKVILSTNIAESSVTVPDVKYVIDFCLTKGLYTDTSTNFTSLQLNWAAKNNCVQRTGRAGRCMSGRCYRLVTKDMWDNFMTDTEKCEMLRSPLDKVVLKTKRLDMGPPQSILALAMDQPKLSDIDNTILILKEMNGLLRTSNGIVTPHDGDLTYVGRVMADLPIDVRLSRLILFGYVFSVLEETIIIAAGLTVRSIFYSLYDAAYSKKLHWSDGSGSDLIAILKTYTVWMALHQSRKFDGEKTEKNWCDRNFLNMISLKEMSNLVQELKSRLLTLGIKERSGVHRASWTNAERSIIIKVVIAGAFYPNYFLRLRGDIENERAMYQQINGRDPCNTVFFTGFNQQYIGPLYKSAIKEILKPCALPKNIKLSFDPNSTKIFATFRNKNCLHENEMGRSDETNLIESMPGHVAIEVYKAVKLRKNQSKNQSKNVIRVMKTKEAIEMAEINGLGMWENGMFVAKKKFIKNIDMICTPRPSVAHVDGIITHVESFNRFWYQPNDEKTLLSNIYDELNQVDSDIEPFENVQDVVVGQYLAAPNDGEYYRCRVESIVKSLNTLTYKVRFIDFGMTLDVDFEQLRRYRGVSAQFIDIPPRIFECRLAGIQPSSLNSERALWTDDSVKQFMILTKNVKIRAEIYSVVDGISNVIIHTEDMNVNEYLIREGLAQKAEETYMSRADHDMRLQKQCSKTSLEDEIERFNENDLLDLMGAGADDDDDETDFEPPQQKLTLKTTITGPFSPLEGTIHAAVNSGAQKISAIEPNSVNSVLLDSTAYDTFDKLVVAATITETSTRRNLTARETTLMPSIPGFSVLMALIFCPYMELKMDKPRSRYISVLCGLGYDEKNDNKPIFDEHDMTLKVDVDISMEDIQLINKIRFTMDSLLLTRPGQEKPHLKDSEINEYTQKIKSYIISLLEEERPLLSTHYGETHVWGIENEEYLLKSQDFYGDRALFPFHSALQFSDADSPERLEQLNNFIENCKNLHGLCNVQASLVRPVKCHLCEIELETLPSVKIHLHSRLHLDREKQINFTLK